MPAVGGGVERAGQLPGDPQGIDGRHRALSNRDVEGFGGDVILGEIGHHARHPGRDRRDNRRVRQLDRNQPLELGDELMDTLGRQIESKQFDGDETIVVRIVRAKDGSRCAGANLMENPERTEGVWRRSTRSVRVQ